MFQKVVWQYEMGSKNSSGLKFLRNLVIKKSCEMFYTKLLYVCGNQKDVLGNLSYYIFSKELDLISHIAATDKIFKAGIIYYLTLNVFDDSSGPLQSNNFTC